MRLLCSMEQIIATLSVTVTRERGWSASDRDCRNGGVRWIDPTGDGEAAGSVSGPGAQDSLFRTSQAVSLIRDAAKDITIALGGQATCGVGPSRRN